MGENKYFKIGFFSSSDFTIKILESILDGEKEGLSLNEKTREKFNLEIFNRPIKLAFVVSQPDRILRKKTVSNPVTKFARENNLAIFTPEKINSDEEFLKNLNGEFEFDLGITASYGQILSQKILNSAKVGFLNWHPSLLPKYRGATPMQTALKNGDQTTGISWIEMVQKMDAGDIFLQEEKEIDQSDDFKILAEKLSSLGQKTWAKASLNYLDKKENLGFEPTEQLDSKATFCKILSKEDGLINPEEMEAKDIRNHFRAYSVFPKTSFQSKYFEGEIKIVELGGFTLNTKQTEDLKVIDDEFLVSKTKDKNGNKVFLKCKNNTFLEIKKICLENGKNIDFRGFEFK